MTSQSLSGRPGPARFYLLFISLLVIGAGNSMLLAVSPVLVRQLRLSDSSIGWIFSLSALLWVWFSPFWGRLSDRVGRRPLIAMGLGAYAVSMAAFGAAVLLGLQGVIQGAPLFFALMLARAIFGAFGSASSPAAQAYIADRTGLLERTEQLAALTGAFALGQAFGPAVCAALAAKLGLVFPIMLIAALAGAASLAILRFLPAGEAPRGETRTSGGLHASLRLTCDPRVSAYLLFGFLLSIVAGVTAPILGLFTMDRLGVEGGQAAEYTAAGFMVGALAMMAVQLGVLPRLRLTGRDLMIWGTALLATGVLMQIIAPTLGALLVSQALQGAGFGLARPGFTGGASLAVESEEQGLVAGLAVATNGAGFLFSPVLGGLAYERISPTAPLYLILPLLALMIVFALRSRRLRTHAHAPPPPPNEPTLP